MPKFLHTGKYYVRVHVEVGIRPRRFWKHFGRPDKSWPCFMLGPVGIWWYS